MYALISERWSKVLSSAFAQARLSLNKCDKSSEQYHSFEFSHVMYDALAKHDLFYPKSGPKLSRVCAFAEARS